jgi:hypothetical protein
VVCSVSIKALTNAVLLSCLLSLTLVACGGKTAPPEQEDDHQVVAAGDIADCESTGDEATAKLVANIEGTVLTLGDNVYERGSAEEYARCYDPTWGRFEKRTKPTPGNHEYHTEGAEGYFDYFGAVAGNANESYYSYDLGSWHVVALNSQCWKIGGCDEEAPQVKWLEADLASIGAESCTLAYFHHPLFTSGEHRPGMPKVRPLWEVLYEAGVDVILNGHDHNYQRFAPQDPHGRADPEGGIRQFVVGTGGRRLYAIEDPPIENTVAYNDDTFGVLKLTLRSDGYEWKFVPVAGKTFTDSGTARCH